MVHNDWIKVHWNFLIRWFIIRQDQSTPEPIYKMVHNKYDQIKVHWKLLIRWFIIRQDQSTLEPIYKMVHNDKIKVH